MHEPFLKLLNNVCHVYWLVTVFLKFIRMDWVSLGDVPQFILHLVLSRSSGHCWAIRAAMHIHIKGRDCVSGSGNKTKVYVVYF